MQSTIVLGAYETTVGRPSAHSKEVSPMASVGKAHRCPLAQSLETEAANSSGTLFFQPSIVALKTATLLASSFA